MTAAEEQIALPLFSWDEGAVVRTKSGCSLRRWGSVSEAGRMLWGYQKDTVYKLIKAGVIHGVKRPGRSCKWRVDLMSVWEYKSKIERGEG